MTKRGLLGNVKFFANYKALPPEVDWREEPYSLNLSNVNYVISERQSKWWQGACFRKVRRKRVLCDITTQYRSGELSAVLGSSGSGKTSLLDVIARRTDGEVTGKITLNNFECDTSFVKQTTAYVIQADRLLHTLTVRETLQYAAFLRLPGNTSAKDRHYKVENVIRQMGLKPVADSKIGSVINRGLSGGEKRRVTIAIQLLHDPSVLLLDEPTTGLDSYTARYLVQCLARIAHNGKLVLLTIHQPRSDVFKLLDNVTLLSAGKMVFKGKSDEMVEYFDGVGYPCPSYANPLDYFIDVSSIDRRDKERELKSTIRVTELLDKFQDSKIFIGTRRFVETNIENSHKNLSLMKVKKTYLPNAFRVLLMLVRRMFLHTSRDRTVSSARLFLLILFTPFIALFLMKLKTDQTSVQDRIGLIFQASSAPPYLAIMNGYALFPSLKDMFYRERMDGLYSIPTFITAYILYILPFTAFAVFGFSLLLYWTTGMYDSWESFGIFFTVLFLLHYMYEIITIGTIGALSDARIGQNIATLVLTFSQVIASGLIRRVDNMFSVLQWLAYAWPHKYSAEILMYNEFSNQVFTGCDKNVTDGCQFPTGNDFLKAYYPNAEDRYDMDLGIMGGGFLLYYLLTMLTYKVRGSRVLH